MRINKTRGNRRNRIFSGGAGTIAGTSGVLLALAGTPSSSAQSSVPPAPPSTTAGQPTPPTAPGAGVSPTKLPPMVTPAAKRTAKAVSMREANDDAPAQPGSEMSVGESMVVDLHVNDEDLANVLEMLSIQSQTNIVASRNVSARVTANLYGVTFYEALEAILHANGYGFVQKGNFIYVYTAEELDAIEIASKKRSERVVMLNYLNAIDAAEFVKPLLSEGGQIKTNGKTGAFPNISETPISADDFANSATLIIYDFDDNINEIVEMIKQIDTKPAQVLVEATILQTSLNENNAFGVDFSLIADLNFADFAPAWGGPLQATNALINGRADPASKTLPFPGPGDQNGRSISSTAGNTAGPGTLKLGIVQNDVAVFLRLLDEVTDVTVLSNPKLLALNRMPSRVLVGRKVGYISTTSTDTATTQTVQFLNTGTQLYFRPFVTNDGQIRMELKPQVSEAQIREVNNATGATVTIPDEITNELVTNVIVGDGQTIVLGGLFREATSVTRRQVPWLGDIPVIGNAFRGNEDSTQRNEIIFLITPHIMNERVLAAQGKRGAEGIERARTGSREGVMSWSRDRRTGMLLVEADKLAAQGKTDRAMWKLQQALNMNSHQPDAMELQERISGKARIVPGKSMLEDIIHEAGMGKQLRGRNADTSMPWWYMGANLDSGNSSSPSQTSNKNTSSVATNFPSKSTSVASTNSNTSSDVNAAADRLFTSGRFAFTPARTPSNINTVNDGNGDSDFTIQDSIWTFAQESGSVCGGRFGGMFRFYHAFGNLPESTRSRLTGVSVETGVSDLNK